MSITKVSTGYKSSVTGNIYATQAGAQSAEAYAKSSTSTSAASPPKTSTTAPTVSAPSTTGLQQYHIGGLYYGYDKATGQLIAFPDVATLKLYFPQGIDNNAPNLPLNPNDNLVLAANKSAGKPVDPSTLKPVAPTTPAQPAQAPAQPANANLGPGTFVDLVKTADNPTIYGQTTDGQWVAIENPQQFTQTGGDFSKVRTVATAPQATNFSQYVPFDPAKYGIDPATFNSLSMADKAFVESTTGLLQNQYNSGVANVSINRDLLNKALLAAQTDPNIVAKYGDAAKLAAKDVEFNLGQISANYATAQTQQQLELAREKQDLEKQIGKAGQAYSGYRKQAETLLGAQQANVIQSTKSRLQQQLQELGRGYEGTFGSDALKKLQKISAGGESYNAIGGIKGTIDMQKQADILNKQAQIYNQEKI